MVRKRGVGKEGLRLRLAGRTMGRRTEVGAKAGAGAGGVSGGEGGVSSGRERWGSGIGGRGELGGGERGGEGRGEVERGGGRREEVRGGVGKLCISVRNSSCSLLTSSLFRRVGFLFFLPPPLPFPLTEVLAMVESL